MWNCLGLWLIKIQLEYVCKMLYRLTRPNLFFRRIQDNIAVGILWRWLFNDDWFAQFKSFLRRLLRSSCHLTRRRRHHHTRPSRRRVRAHWVFRHTRVQRCPLPRFSRGRWWWLKQRRIILIWLLNKWTNRHHTIRQYCAFRLGSLSLLLNQSNHCFKETPIDPENNQVQTDNDYTLDANVTPNQIACHLIMNFYFKWKKVRRNPTCFFVRNKGRANLIYCKVNVVAVNLPNAKLNVDIDCNSTKIEPFE